jgi:hypothetical protein
MMPREASCKARRSEAHATKLLILEFPVRSDALWKQPEENLRPVSDDSYFG